MSVCNVIEILILFTIKQQFEFKIIDVTFISVFTINARTFDLLSLVSSSSEEILLEYILSCGIYISQFVNLVDVVVAFWISIRFFKHCKIQSYRFTSSV